jgi:isochorismate hydrolase
MLSVQGRGHFRLAIFHERSVTAGTGVESTARSAYDYGNNIVLIVDAMTDLDADAHRHCLEKVFPRLGETDTTDNVLNRLHNTHPH